MLMFDDTRYLGRMCKRGHDWNGTGRSLRQRSNRTCIECKRLAANTDHARAKRRDAYRRYAGQNREELRRRRRAGWWRHRKKRLEKQQRYYRANRDKILADQKRYREYNREAIKARRKARYEANKEKIWARERARYCANKEKVKARVRAYQRSNPDAVRAHQDRRRGRKRGATGSYTAKDVADMYANQCGLCAYCESLLDGKYHVDHMTPLCRGGANGWENLALVCPPCNLRKHARTVEEFFGSPRDPGREAGVRDRLRRVREAAS